MSLTRTFDCSADNMRRALDQLQALGAHIQGDARSGTLAGRTPVGRLAGTYSHDGRSLTLTLTEWPALIPRSFLEGKLDDLIRRYGGQ